MKDEWVEAEEKMAEEYEAPRKDFVRLSQEEIQTIYLTRYDTPNLFARAIEDALEEKNK